MLKARHTYIVSRLSDAFGTDEAETREAVRKALPRINEFLSGEGPAAHLLAYYQPRDVRTEEGEWLPGTGKPEVFFTYGEEEKLRNNAVYMIRAGDAVDVEKANDGSLLFGEVSKDPLAVLQAQLSEVYGKHVSERADWGKAATEQRDEFKSELTKVTSSLAETMRSFGGGLELAAPDASVDLEEAVKSTVPRGKGKKATFDEEMVKQLQTLLENWCGQIDKYLGDVESAAAVEHGAGPMGILEYWRTRMQRLTSVTEQLKRKDVKTVVTVLTAITKGPASDKAPSTLISLLRKWKDTDMNITEAANEAKDNVKYLFTLEKFVEPLYTGTPVAVLDTLPALMNSIKMIHTIARYFNTPERMTDLFVKITHAMIANGKTYILDLQRADVGESLWKKDTVQLITRLEQCLKVNEMYQETYRLTKEKLAANPKGKQFDFNEQAIFGRFDLFCRRVIKLIDLFSTIQQFRTLGEHKLEGMEALIKEFEDLAFGFQAKRHDLLAFTGNEFDRDFVEFNVNIDALEVKLQQFINGSFESIKSIDGALNLLAKFKAVLQRDSLKADLDDKVAIIFASFGNELEAVQALYEEDKHNPPKSRNLPPVAGNITWSRHLLHRIEGPMKRFEAHPQVFASKEGKRIVKMYNRIARTLVAYEYLWYNAWVESIETAKAGLQATLIIRHPEDGKLYVNFDAEILQLIREAKCLDRMGIAIPESAKIVLLQETKFKSYFNDLSYALKEFARITRKIIPVTAPLLRPSLHDMEYRLRPGMITLTWTSMNIDAYKSHVQTGLHRLEELIRIVNDVVENRVEKNLRVVSKTLLVNLPPDRSFTLDEFVSMQQEHVQEQANILQGKNQEVESAVLDLIGMIRAYTVDPHIEPVGDADCKKLVEHYNHFMYTALLNCAKNSLNALKKRVSARTHTSWLYTERPFFELEVQLVAPYVRLTPSLEEVQSAINKCATAVLGCSKLLFDWGQEGVDEDERATFFNRITNDLEIVRVVLLLTGSIQGTKAEVESYLTSFGNFEWLWKSDADGIYKEFMKKNPAIDDYERELQKFAQVDEQITAVHLIHNIGALSLNTAPIKTQLRTLNSQWKVQYSDNLHKTATNQLTTLTEYFKSTLTKLNREPDSIDSIKYLMDVLNEIRDREASIDMQINPVMDMYALLEMFLPDGYMTKDEQDMRAMLRVNWMKLRDKAEEVTEEIAALQAGFRKKLLEDVKSFKDDVKAFRADYLKNGPMVKGISANEAQERLRRYEDELDIRARKRELYLAGEDLFALPRTEYPDLDATEKEVSLLGKLYGLYRDVTGKMEEYRSILWTDTVANIDAMTQETESFSNRCKKMPKKLREWEAYTALKQQIEDFQLVLPLLQELSKPSVLPRHWVEIEKLTGHKLNVSDAEFKLQQLLDAPLVAKHEEIEEITDRADKELGIDTKMTELIRKWLGAGEKVPGARFSFSTWKQRGVPVLTGVGAVVEELEESQMIVQTLASSKAAEFFKPSLAALLKTLSNTADNLEQWYKIQIMWCSLESVFLGGDIAKQMPVVAKKFQKIDKDFVNIMARAQEQAEVVKACANEVLVNNLKPMFSELESCQKSLEGYLEQKRNKFPRFYFVSNPVLLQILSQGSDPLAVQQYYEKIFDSISSVEHDKKDKFIIQAMIAREGSSEEKIGFRKVVKVAGNIEDWLMDVLKEMQRTMKVRCEEAALEVAMASKDLSQLRRFVDNACGQYSLLGIQLMWTADCEEALTKSKKDKNSVRDANKKSLDVLSTLSSWCLQDLGSKMNRIKVETLVTIQVHQRDVIDDIFKLYRAKKISGADDFEWLKQARFYWEPEARDFLDDNGCCRIRITDVPFDYQYEYLGCKERLVITPLTDRCYITLAQALNMFFGGAPAGPAGTGKTETTKDMGRALGIFVVVTNCTDQMRYTDCAKIFKGLCQGGLWGCFDEFNRITLPVLSVVAQQVLAITNAKKANVEYFQFPGDPQNVLLNSVCGFFITMNPGYAGRQELPENLKALFRGVAMMVPDREIIMKVKLCSVGYSDFTLLARKFFICYQLCEQQLSKQKHYDFGLRNILSVLRTAGATKRDNLTADEELLLYRTLRDMNLSKFVAQDVPLFMSMLEDLFPKQSAPTKRVYPAVEAAIKNTVAENKLILHADWVTKVIQLYETCLVRHGIMLTGPAGSGKTRIMETLQTVLTVVDGKQVRIQRMNPKAIQAHEMYGQADSAGEWVKGVFASIWEKYNNRDLPYITWIVMDGPVDAIWIEDLNCFPADDHELLTAHGFWNLAQVLDHFSRHETLDMACYVDGRLEYHPVTRDKLHIKDGVHNFVDMESADSNVSVMPTTNHRMWAKMGSSQGKYQIHQAGTMLQAAAADASTRVQFLTRFEEGEHVVEKDLPFEGPLGLHTADQVDAFLELYGYWLADGAVNAQQRSISVQSKKQEDKQYLGSLFARLAAALPATSVSKEGERYDISEPAWVDYFASEYATTAQNSEKEEDANTAVTVSPAAEVAAADSDVPAAPGATMIPRAAVYGSNAGAPLADAQDAQSTKRFWSWVWRRLGARRLRLILRGLRSADAKTAVEAAAENDEAGCIETSDVAFRDELQRLMLHAGFTTSVTINEKAAEGTSYTVHYALQGKLAEPVLSASEDMKAVRGSGRVWCVSVPTKEQLIMVRRVLSRNTDGTANATSRPMVVGNTVLDDNKILTLASGDRMPMTDNVKIMFENESLANASPATVSRAGIIFVSETDLDWRPVVESWILSRPVDTQQPLRDLFLKLVGECNPLNPGATFNFIYRNCDAVMPTSRVGTMAGFYHLLTVLMDRSAEFMANATAEPDKFKSQLERMMLFCLTWTVGSMLEVDNRKALDAELRRIAGAAMPKCDVGETIYEYTIDPKTLDWAKWRPPVWVYPEQEKLDFSNLLVPSMDSTRSLFLIEALHSVKKPVLLLGGPGTAKTSTALMFFATFDPAVRLLKRINFSSATVPGMFQESIEAELEKRGGKSFGPPNNKKMTVFVDDISMPLVNTWGDQPTNEIVRQIIEMGGVYFLDKDKRGDFKVCEDLQYVAAMIHPGGGRNDVPNRLKRQFFAFNLVLPSMQSIDDLYGQMLRGRFKESEFQKALVEDAARLTGATISLWGRIKAKMLPTPAKFHYIFNMRELSRVFQGILLTPKDTIKMGGQQTPSDNQSLTLLRLFRHEAYRVFADKLTTFEDKNFFTKVLEEVMEATFGAEKAAASHEEYFFVDFFREDKYNEDDVLEELAPKIYEPGGTLENVRQRVLNFMQKHNEEFPATKLELVLFDDALRHLIRISRIIQMPRGSALLVGVGGSGKQSLTKLAAYIARSTLFQIKLVKGYGVKDLKEDLLNKVYDPAGHMRKSVTFLFTDAEIKDENFLEYINSILMTGEVAGLIPKDKLLTWTADLMNAFLKERPGVPETADNLKQFLIDNARDNIHLVLCMSPVNAKFPERARKFPGLISGTTIDWFLAWPEDALRAVAHGLLNDYKMDVEWEKVPEGAPPVKVRLMEHMGRVHQLVVETCAQYFAKMRRNVYQTPKSFLSFIAAYKGMYGKKLEELQVKESNINRGLDKLIKGAADVEAMKITLAEKQVELNKATDDTNKLLASLTVRQAEAEQESAKVAVIKANCESEATRIGQEKASCEADLARAQPIVDRAVKAVNSIQPNDINEVKRLGKPSDIIRLVFDVVIILFMKPLGPPVAAEVTVARKTYQWINPSYEVATGQILNDPAFLKNLQTYPKDLLNEETVELCKPYTEGGDFTPEVAKGASQAAEGLCTWAKAMGEYYYASKFVKPKLEALSLAMSQLDAAMQALAAAEKKEQEVMAMLAKLKADFDKQMGEKAKLEEGAAILQRKLDQASALINGLAGERVRWGEDSKMFADTKKRLIGDCAAACAFLSYCGPFNQEYRSILLNERFISDARSRNVPVTKDLDIISFVGDPSLLGKWNLQGLPTDPLSLQNGILVDASSRYPLLIDPQGQALTWLRQKEAERDRLPREPVTALSSPQLKSQLEFCLGEGKALIVVGVEQELDPLFDPVLEKNFIQKGSKRLVKMPDGDKELSPKFCLYFITRLPNPHFSPELQAKTTVVDFTVTQKGLEEQLLGKVIAKEQNALEKLLNQVLAEANANTSALLQLDKQLLQKLSDNQGSLLEDETLISTLAETKAKAAEVKEKLAAADETKRSINEKREQFRPVATRGSVLYFAIVEMSLVNVMYQTSLAQFTELFMKSMDVAKKAPLASDRVANIIKELTYIVYRYINKGLYERDKLLFVFIVAVKVLVTAGTLKPSEVSLFLRAGAAISLKDQPRKPPSWMSAESWANVLALSQGVDFFSALPDTIYRNESQWRRWYEDNEPERLPIPDLDTSLNENKEVGPWRRLLLIRSLRMDRTQLSVRQFIRHMPDLGEPYVEPVTDTIEMIFDDMVAHVPVIFLLSIGADPTDSIEQLAKKKKTSVQCVSLGEGQEPVAMKAINAASVNGTWVLLQNCELGLDLMDKMEDLINRMRENINADFRLFITALPSPQFPLGLLQMSTKVTNEPPAGLRAGLLRSYTVMVDQDRLERIDAPAWRQLVFAMCFMHSVAQERRKFGPLGWCIPYEYNNGDLSACLLFLEKHLYSGIISWPTVQYIISEVQYGGKITDNIDRRMFNTYTAKWISQAVLEGNYTYNPDKPLVTIPHKYTILDAPDIDSYRAFISKFPEVDTPEIFGLHPNADLTFRVKEATAMLNTMGETQPKQSGGGGGKSMDQQVREAACMYLERIPPDYVEEEYKIQIRKLGGMGEPLNIFLYQEVQRLQAVIGKVRGMLRAMVQAIDGEVVMTAELLQAMTDVFDGKVPRPWLFTPGNDEFSWLIPYIASWFEGLGFRVKELTAWLTEKRPSSFWMTGFANPQGFLTSMKQEVVKMHKAQVWALDDVDYYTEVMSYDSPVEGQSVNPSITSPKEGVYIHGLFLEGARWDKGNNTLAESEPKKLFVSLPLIYCTVMTKSLLNEARAKFGVNGLYEAPCYRYAARTDRWRIFMVTIPTKGMTPEHWTLRGVAVLALTV